MPIPFTYIGLTVFIVCVFVAILTIDSSILNPKRKLLPLIVVIMGFAVLFGAMKVDKNKQDAERRKFYEQVQEKQIIAQQMIDNGANVYIDGQLIDGTKIVLGKYDITIVDDFIILNN